MVKSVHLKYDELDLLSGQTKGNRISDVIVGMLASSIIDHQFEPRSNKRL
jgi:hypothetical protein